MIARAFRLLVPTLVVAPLVAAPPLGAAPPAVRDATWIQRSATDPAPLVAAAGRDGAEWLAWTVPGTPRSIELCCFDRDWHNRRCTLEGREGGWGSSRAEGALEPTAAAELHVLVEVDRGLPLRVRSLGADCPIEGRGRTLMWLHGVTPEASLALLGSWVRATPDVVADGALAAIAHHQGAGADRLFGALADHSGLERKRRETLYFWAGEARGRAGFELLDRRFDAERSGDLREHMLFALTQNGSPEAFARVRRAAVDDREPEVRSQALFWLAESDAPGAASFVLERIATDPSAEVREQGVFALSQLENGVPELLRLLREGREPEVRRQALFWLGQSEDPRALAALEEVLGGP